MPPDQQENKGGNDVAQADGLMRGEREPPQKSARMLPRLSEAALFLLFVDFAGLRFNQGCHRRLSK